MENAVGFLRRNLMVPPPNAESHRQLTRHLLSGCDAIADVDHYRSGRTIRDMFADDLEDMLPLPRARFDAVEWVERRADREGNVEIRLQPLPRRARRGARWTLQVGLRAFDVEIRTRDGRKVNTLPRVYGRCGERTVRNPACLLPALARKPRAWGESPIRGDFPGKLRLRIGRDGLRGSATHAPSDRQGVGRQRLQGGHGRRRASRRARTRHRRGQPDDAGAQEIAAGETPHDEPAPDLHDYDRFMRPADDRKEA